METNNKLREALKELLDAMYDMGIDEETVSMAAESPNCHMHSKDHLDVIKKAKAAIAEPIKNCEVGTVEEQAERWNNDNPYPYEWDDRQYYDALDMLKWAQTPYEEGGEK